MSPETPAGLRTGPGFHLYRKRIKNYIVVTMSSWPKVKSATIDAGSHALDLNLINATRVNLVVLIGVRHTLPTATRHRAPFRVETAR